LGRWETWKLWSKMVSMVSFVSRAMKSKEKVASKIVKERGAKMESFVGVKDGSKIFSQTSSVSASTVSTI
jgi:hypothetical protein